MISDEDNYSNNFCEFYASIIGCLLSNRHYTSSSKLMVIISNIYIEKILGWIESIDKSQNI